MTDQNTARDPRLTSLLASIGLDDLDALEDFIFLHGAARLVPLDSDEATNKSLETQQLISNYHPHHQSSVIGNANPFGASTTAIEQINQARKKALKETKEKVETLKKENTHLKASYAKIVEECRNLKKDRDWLLRLQEVPPQRPLPLLLPGPETGEGEEDEDSSRRTIPKESKGKGKEVVVPMERDWEVEDVEHAELVGACPKTTSKPQLFPISPALNVKDAMPASSTHQAVPSSSNQSAEIKHGPTSSATVVDATEHLAVPQSTRRSSQHQRANQALYETLRIRYEANVRIIKDIDRWTNSHLEKFVQANQAHLNELGMSIPPRPALEDDKVLPTFASVQELLEGSSREGGDKGLAEALEELSKWDEMTRSHAANLRDWKSSVKTMAYQTSELKKAKDAARSQVPVKKKRKKVIDGTSSTLSNSSNRVHSRMSSIPFSPRKRSSSPAPKILGKSRSSSPTRQRRRSLSAASEALLVGPASGMASHANAKTVFANGFTTSPVATPVERGQASSSPSSPRQPITASPNKLATIETRPRHWNEQEQETQLPDSPKKSEKRKANLDLRTSSVLSNSSKRSRLSVAAKDGAIGSRLKMSALVYSGRTSSAKVEDGNEEEEEEGMNGDLMTSPTKSTSNDHHNLAPLSPLLRRTESRNPQTSTSAEPHQSYSRRSMTTTSSWGPEPETEQDDIFPPPPAPLARSLPPDSSANDQKTIFIDPLSSPLSSLTASSQGTPRPSPSPSLGSPRRKLPWLIPVGLDDIVPHSHKKTTLSSPKKDRSNSAFASPSSPLMEIPRMINSSASYNDGDDEDGLVVPFSSKTIKNASVQGSPQGRLDDEDRFESHRQGMLEQAIPLTQARREPQLVPAVNLIRSPSPSRKAQKRVVRAMREEEEEGEQRNVDHHRGERKQPQGLTSTRRNRSRSPMKYHAILGSPPLPQTDWAAIEAGNRKKQKKKGAQDEDHSDAERMERREALKKTEKKSRVDKLRNDRTSAGHVQSDDGVVYKKATSNVDEKGKKRARKSEGDALPQIRNRTKTSTQVPEDEDGQEEEEEPEQGEDDPTGHDFMRKLHAKRAKEVKQLAAEKANRSRNINKSPAIEINPARNGGKDFHFYEVERSKAAREQMFAHECEGCAGYYAIAHAGLTVPAHMNRTCHHNRRPNEGSSTKKAKEKDIHFLGQRQQAMQEMLQKTSRHRKHHRPDPTPPDFWQMGFPSTAQVEDINSRAEQNRQDRQLYQQAEASKQNGFYRYRDEEMAANRKHR